MTALTDLTGGAKNLPDITLLDDPYIRAEVEAKDHTNIYRVWCKGMSRSTTAFDTKTAQGVGLVGFDNNNTTTVTGYLTWTRTIDTPGLYRFLLRTLRTPSSATGTVELKIDSTSIGTRSTHFPVESIVQYDYGLYYLSTGSHTFRVDITGRESWVDTLTFYRVEQHSTESSHTSTRLDLLGFEFTTNTINELNGLTLDVAMKEDYIQPDTNPYSRRCFDFTDPVTIYLGSSRRDSRAMFGGYLVGYSEMAEGDTLSLQGADRLLDWYREPYYYKFMVGTRSKAKDDPYKDYKHYSNGVEAVQKLGQTVEYPLQTGGMSPVYGFFEDFTNFNLTYAGTKPGKWLLSVIDRKTGNPFLKLHPGTQTGPAYFQIYNHNVPRNTRNTEDPIDLSEHDTLTFQYLGAKNKPPLRVNLKISVYLAGETPDDAEDYHIIFTGSKNVSNIIGTIDTPTFDNTWHRASINLKECLDKFVGGGEYYLTLLELSTILFTSDLNPKKDPNKTRVLQIDHVVIQDDNLVGNSYIPEEGALYPFDIANSVAGSMGYVVWVTPGRERRMDTLQMAPLNEVINPQRISERTRTPGDTETPLISYMSEIMYTPREDGLTNQVYKNYHYTKTGADSEVTGKVYKEELDSMLRYGPWETYEDLSNSSDTDSKARGQATAAVDRELESKVYSYPQFSISIPFNTLLEPNQTILLEADSRGLSGYHTPAGIIHRYTQDEGGSTQIDLGALSDKFREQQINLTRYLRRNINQTVRSVYSKRCLQNMGLTTFGYTRTGSGDTT